MRRVEAGYRSDTLAAPVYTKIDALKLYEALLIELRELPAFMPAHRLRQYYNRTGRHAIKSHVVADGVLVVRVE